MFGSIILSLFLILQTRADLSENQDELLIKYTHFFNFGNETYRERLQEEYPAKKVDILGVVFKNEVDKFKVQGVLDILFLVDASSSVGETNFQSELKFVRKLLSDIVIDSNHSRISLVTFSSPGQIIANINEIPKSDHVKDKCVLLNENINEITYTSGGTYTLGALEKALEIFEKSRKEVPKILFLVTDGFSNGGDPVPIARKLKQQQNVTIFTIGISNGNFKELYDISSDPGERHSFLLDSFDEFENLARRALHVDMQNGEYVPMGTQEPCNKLCTHGNCCDENAVCSCGSSSGQYQCLCKVGYYGSGLSNCLPCPSGSYAAGENLCLPCPDVHHTTKAGSIGIESCTCKTGFVSGENHTCNVIVCPKLSAPENGYFVKSNECSNVYNSACGVRCNVGYTLTGSSIRLCQENAAWSGLNSSCQVRSCPKLEPPIHGNLKCSHGELNLETFLSQNDSFLPVDTICRFHCEKGRTLIGSKQRTCLPLAQWDGLRASCKQIKCNKLTKINYGSIEPKSCTVGKQSFGKICKIKCFKGYTIKNVGEIFLAKECNGEHGTWNNSQITTCIDTSPPVIQCPKDIIIESLKGKPYGILDWQSPVTSDNSKQNITIWSEPVIKGSQKFKIGAHNVTYFAEDPSGNYANCSFVVTVIDKEPPTIELCIDPPTYLISSSLKVNISWDEPIIFDNSQNVTVTKSKDFGPLPLGVNQVIYKAIDLSNNTNECTMNITLEEEKNCERNDLIVQYGNTTCETSYENDLQCVITCQEGYALLIPVLNTLTPTNTTNFECHEGVWNFNRTSPECAITQVPNEIHQSGVLSKELEDSENCQHLKVNQTQEEIENLLREHLKNCRNTNDCNINTEIVCEDFGNKRTKRNTKSKGRNKKKIVVKFDITTQNISRKLFEESVDLTNWNITRLDIVNFRCPLGMFLRKNKCYMCPMGTFHNITMNFCQSCPIGTYSNKTGQMYCEQCPENYSTRRLHAKSFAECAAKCSPGKFAHIKKIKHYKNQPSFVTERNTLHPYCSSCPLGQYQPNYGQLTCLQCPLNKTTSLRGALDINDCQILNPCKINPCLNEGQCRVINNFGHKCLCPENFTGTSCEIFKDPCLSDPCQNNGVCNFIDWENYRCDCLEEFTGPICEQSKNACSLNCSNNSTCVSLEEENEEICLCPPGYEGDLCQEKINYCLESLCENGGTCKELTDGYQCKCPSGYLGVRCSYVPCDFHPCPEHNICTNQDLVVDRTSFKCICPFGFKGPKCSEIFKFCESNPCVNNAQCEDTFGNYSCKCPKGFWGTNCEIKLSQNYTLVFLNSGTTDFVSFKGPSKNLTELSVCTWMQSNDVQNYGTLLSYATEDHQNAFTITDYNGIVLYVNDHYKVTDVTLNDGQWHHFCLIWSNTGEFHIYVDSNIQHTGTNLGKGLAIPGGGLFVIGQEQDVMGGRFSQSESFLGKISYMDIYDKILTELDVTEIMINCKDILMGSLYAWPEFSLNIHGDVKIEMANNFCSPCTQPKSPINGFVNVESDMAYYGCDNGYMLNSYLSGRRCLKAGRWDGKGDPMCLPVKCGHPGVIKNGYIVGNKYSYDEEIFYKCNAGYKIKGIPVRRCSETGKWEPIEPKCLGLKCPLSEVYNDSQLYEKFGIHYEDEEISELTFEELKNLENTNMEIGTQIEITCPKNYKLIGENVLTCLSDGNWDLLAPQCIFNSVICPVDHVPDPPTNGLLMEESKSNFIKGLQDFVEYTCLIGYQPFGDNYSLCIVDGYWSEVKLECKVTVCSSPPDLSAQNLVMVEAHSENFHVGDEVRYECLEGFKIFNSEPLLKCLGSGNWREIHFQCLRKSCKKPKVNKDTRVLGTSYFYMDRIHLICSGELRVVQCSSNSTWLPNYKQCFLE